MAGSIVDAEALAEVFKALSNPVRLEILLRMREGELCVQELQDDLGRNQPNISQHLAVLRTCGLVAGERKGKKICYRVTDERIWQMIALAEAASEQLRPPRRAAATEPAHPNGGSKMEILVAFSTHDGENLVTDDHAGMATYFDVYRFTEDDVEFVERRENSKYGGDETLQHGDPKKANKSLDALGGVDAWANPRFGPNLPRLLKKILCVVVRVSTVQEGVELVRRHLEAVATECGNGEDRRHLVLSTS